MLIPNVDSKSDVLEFKTLEIQIIKKISKDGTYSMRHAQLSSTVTVTFCRSSIVFRGPNFIVAFFVTSNCI